MTVETLCAAFRVYFAFASQNITILYIFSQLFFHLSFGSLKQKVTLGVKICIIPSIKYSLRAISVQLWLGFEPNWSQKRTRASSVTLNQCPLWVRLQWRRRRWRRTRPRSPPSSRSRWSGGTSWGWTAPPPCCPPSASSGPPATEMLFRNWEKLDAVGIICFCARQNVQEILFYLHHRDEYFPKIL